MILNGKAIIITSSFNTFNTKDKYGNSKEITSYEVTFMQETEVLKMPCTEDVYNFASKHHFKECSCVVEIKEGTKDGKLYKTYKALECFAE